MVTFIGHATFLIQTQAGNLLTDPMYSQRAGPLNLIGPRRVRQPAIRFDDLPPISTVLLSHNHYDHCDLPTLRRLAKRFDPTVVTPLGNGRVVRSAGIRRVEELDWWQETTSGAWPITLTPAQHFSARTSVRSKPSALGRLHGRGQATSASSSPETRPTRDFFTDIRRRLGPIDLALLPIGAYEPRWFMKAVHMNPAEAVQAHLDLEASRKHRHALRHVPDDDRGHRRAAACARRGPPREQRPAVTVSDAWFRGIGSAAVGVFYDFAVLGV